MSAEVTITQTGWDRYEVTLNEEGALFFYAAARQLGISVPPGAPGSPVTVGRSTLARVALGARNALANAPLAIDDDQIPAAVRRRFAADLKKQFVQWTPSFEWSARTGVLSSRPDPAGTPDSRIVTIDAIAYDLLCGAAGHYVHHVGAGRAGTLASLAKRLAAQRTRIVDLLLHQSFANGRVAAEDPGLVLLVPCAQVSLTLSELRELAEMLELVVRETAPTEMPAVVGFPAQSVQAVAGRFADLCR